VFGQERKPGWHRLPLSIGVLSVDSWVGGLEKEEVIVLEHEALELVI
jgi:hypothetical protein